MKGQAGKTDPQYKGVGKSRASNVEAEDTDSPRKGDKSPRTSGTDQTFIMKMKNKGNKKAVKGKG
jgi:hypothetical protein